MTRSSHDLVMDKAERGHIRRLGLWMNAIADAWNMGQAPWAYDAGGSVAMQAVAPIFAAAGHEAARRAADVVQELARSHGVDPLIHRYHGKRGR